MADEFEYISHARLAYRDGYRRAYLGNVPEPVVSTLNTLSEGMQIEPDVRPPACGSSLSRIAARGPSPGNRRTGPARQRRGIGGNTPSPGMSGRAW